MWFVQRSSWRIPGAMFTLPFVGRMRGKHWFAQCGLAPCAPARVYKQKTLCKLMWPFPGGICALSNGDCAPAVGWRNWVGKCGFPARKYYGKNISLAALWVANEDSNAEFNSAFKSLDGTVRKEKTPKLQISRPWAPGTSPPLGFPRKPGPIRARFPPPFFFLHMGILAYPLTDAPRPCGPFMHIPLSICDHNCV